MLQTKNGTQTKFESEIQSHILYTDHEPGIDPATHLGEARQGALDSLGVQLP